MAQSGRFTQNICENREEKALGFARAGTRGHKQIRLFTHGSEQCFLLVPVERVTVDSYPVRHEFGEASWEQVSVGTFEVCEHCPWRERRRRLDEGGLRNDATLPHDRSTLGKDLGAGDLVGGLKIADH